MADCKTCNFENICEMPDFVRNNLKDCKVYEPKKKQTNADRLRAMSDEELAEFLERFGTFNQPCSLSVGEPLKWLQSEAEEPYD